MGYQATELQMALTVSRIVTIHYFEYTSNYSYDGESHPFWEFLYVDKGEVEVSGDDRQYVLKKGQMIFHKPGEFHKLWANGEVAPNLVVISFECDSPAMRFFENRVLAAGDVERDCMAAVISEAQSAFATPLNDPDTQLLERRPEAPFAAEQVIRLNLEWMLIHLLRTARCAATRSPAPREPSGGVRWQMISNVSAPCRHKVPSSVTRSTVSGQRSASRRAVRSWASPASASSSSV